MPKTSVEGSIYPHRTDILPFPGNHPSTLLRIYPSSCQNFRCIQDSLCFGFWRLYICQTIPFRYNCKPDFHSWFLLYDQIDWLSKLFSNIRAGQTCNIALSNLVDAFFCIFTPCQCREAGQHISKESVTKFCIQGNAFCAGGEAGDAPSHLLSSYLSGFKSGSIPLMDDTSAKQSTLPGAQSYLRVQGLMIHIQYLTVGAII